LAVPPYAEVRYVDRMTVEELRREYPELVEWQLTEVDVVDDGETLRTIDAGSQDFIIANHFLEHCENPIGTIETHLEKLKPGGVLFYAVPDKRFTFDFRRPLTPLEHFAADYEHGPDRSRREHFEEWAALVDSKVPYEGEGQPPEHVLERARHLEEIGYSIHMHVWTQAEFLRLVLHCRERLDDGFDIEAAARQGIEFIVVLRKQGPFPAPPPAPAPTPENAAGAAIGWRARLRRAAGAARRELRRPR
jgi:SAM-dependent methyltransferase